MPVHPVGRWLILALILVAVLISMLVWLRNNGTWRLPPGEKDASWRELLDWYVGVLNQDDGRMTSIAEIVRAQHPERFAQGMSRHTVSDKAIFRTDSVPAGVSAAQLDMLPFPPTELQCAVLKITYTTDPALNVPDEDEIVMLAYHEEGALAGWVIHLLTARGDALSLQHVLDEVGCAVTAAGNDRAP